MNRGRPCRTRALPQLLVRVLLLPPHMAGTHAAELPAHRPYSVYLKAATPPSREAGDGISSGSAPPPHPTHHAHSTEGLYSVCRRPIFPASQERQGWDQLWQRPTSPPYAPSHTARRGFPQCLPGGPALPCIPGSRGWDQLWQRPTPHPTPHHTHRTEGLYSVLGLLFPGCGLGVSSGTELPAPTLSLPTKKNRIRTHFSSGFPPWGSSPGRSSILKTSITKTINNVRENHPYERTGLWDNQLNNLKTKD